MKQPGGKKLATLAALLLMLMCERQAAAQTAQANTEPNSKYFTAQTITLGDGTSLEKYILNGPPSPPEGYELKRAAVALPGPSRKMATNTLTVPAYDWVFGSAAVSGAMIAAYYDRNGYPNIYTGATNSGVMPLDSSAWGTWSDGVDTYPNNPLVASHNGVDGRAVKGSIDDYWVQYGSSASDPYITGAWTQHAWGTAIGDYMKTSQSAYGNVDGSTTFWNYTSSASPLTCSDMESGGISTTDGTYGRKLFYEARGYTVTDCYSQKTDNTVAGGFSFAQFKAEIDANRPVMLCLAGLQIVGVGYEDSSQTVYVHDTWDYVTHTMTWGGSYSGMQLLSVSVVNLAPACIDNDGDTYGESCAAGPDCNDTDPAVHATATYYTDADGDGFGTDNASEHCSLTPQAGYSSNSSDCNDADSFYNKICPDCEVKIIPKTLGWLVGDKEKTRSLLVIGARGTEFGDNPTITWESDAIEVLSKSVFFKRFMFMRAKFNGEPLEKKDYRVLVNACEGKITWAK